MRQAWPEQGRGDSMSIFLSASHHLCGVDLIGDSIILVIHLELTLRPLHFEVTDFAIFSVGFPF